MAHIINKIDVMSRSEAKLRHLCCMGECSRKKSVIHDSEGIYERLQKAGMLKRLFEADTFEKENKIIQKSAAAQNSIK